MIFGTVKQVSIGPTSLMSLLVLPATYGKPIEYVFVLSFIAGCVELLLGVLRLGFIVDFIPLPVTSAFTSATALIIVASQLKSITGTSYLASSFGSYIVGFFETISLVRLGDTILGVCCILALLLMKVIEIFFRVRVEAKTSCNFLLNLFISEDTRHTRLKDKSKARCHQKAPLVHHHITKCACCFHLFHPFLHLEPRGPATSPLQIIRKSCQRNT